MSVLPPTPGLQTTFDDNNEDLLHLLTDAWENPLKDTIIESKWTRDYLTKLTTLPLDELLHEPTELKEEQAKAKRDAQLLAFRDYPAFLHAQTCRREAEETLDGLHLHLGEFLSSVPELQHACEEFTSRATELKEERGKITSVLEHQNVLTDLLEIPQLMETCVWNGYYAEAMDLASHVRLLQVRYPLSVVKSIQQQVQASSDLMLVQLISHLQKPIRLAAAMNVVGFLRRMDAFESEPQLRMVFLRCRHEFLQQRLLRVKRDISEDPRQRSVDAFEYLKRFMDVMREQMFEIGTQYISIFSNEQGTLLSDYMVNITTLIKNTLKTYLPMIEDTSALASLLSQLQYCGLSLGRIGLDFRHIFVHAFEEAVQPMILKWIDATTEDLVKIIVKSTEEAAAPSTWMSSKIASQNTSGAIAEEGKRNAFQPPMLLVGYPSLAIFTNGILSTLNALRLLPALSLFLPIQNHLEACFLEIGNALKQYADQAASHIPDEVTYLQSFSAAFVRCCVPYLKFCLVNGIYGELAGEATADEDLELLLTDYLPVVKKEEYEEIKEESPKKEEENEVVKEKEEAEDSTTPEEPIQQVIEDTKDEPAVDILDELVNVDIKEEVEAVDSMAQEEPIQQVAEETKDKPAVDEPVDTSEVKPVNEIQGGNSSEEKEKTDKLMNPNLENDPVLNNLNQDDKEALAITEDSAIKEENKVDDIVVEDVKDFAVESIPEKESKDDDVVETKDTLKPSTEEASVQPTAIETPPVAEEPAAEEPIAVEPVVDDSVVNNSVQDELPVEPTTVEAKEVESEPTINANPEDNSTSETTKEDTITEPSTAELTDEEPKPTPEKKQPPPQKKSKKKGKKGRR